MARCLLASVFCLIVAAPAHAFRCGNSLVSEGDTRSEVLAICGEPTEVESRRTILRRPIVWIDGRLHTFGEGYVEIPVEIWIYNLGPRRLMRRLRFEDGRLVDIETLGYGYHTRSPER
jgi:hypothetical protein